MANHYRPNTHYWWCLVQKHVAQLLLCPALFSNISTTSTRSRSLCSRCAAFSHTCNCVCILRTHALKILSVQNKSTGNTPLEFAERIISHLARKHDRFSRRRWKGYVQNAELLRKRLASRRKEMGGWHDEKNDKRKWTLKNIYLV